MTQRQSFGTLIAYVVLILSSLAASTVLAALGKIDSAAVMTVLGGVSGAAAVLIHSTATAAINGGPKPDLSKLAVSDPQALERMMAKASPPATGQTAHDAIVAAVVTGEAE